MKQLFYSVTVLCLILNACQKSAEPLTIDPPPISCEIVPNDTLMITYPCDGQINFIPDSFSWKFGVIGEQLEGFVEHIYLSQISHMASTVVLVGATWATPKKKPA
ncbi:MAG: hypothetical protein IPH31_10270 [Lewinellaceae bacterium]|nr:hypothetical protein [Lewinellaceae bacterium]